MLACLKAILDTETRNGADTVVLLGDVFDTPSPRQRTLVALLELLSKYPQVTFHAIVGNHDAVGATDVKADTAQHSFEVYAWLARQKKAKIKIHTQPTVVQIGGLKYFMCPHPFIEDQPEGCHLSFGHFGWTGARTDTGYTNRSGHTPKGEWVLGDYHTPQQGDRYRYAGSLTQITFGEKQAKTYLRISDRGVVTEAKVPLTYLLDAKVKVTNDADYSALKKAQKAEPPTFYSVVFENYVPSTNWQAELPRVVRHDFDKTHVGTGDVSETKATLSLVFSDTKSLVTTGLRGFMEKRGCPPKEAKAGEALVKTLVKGMRV